jgi:hypothetical protein
VNGKKLVLGVLGGASVGALAGGGATPILGSGAGVGRGMFSATAGLMAHAAQTIAARITEFQRAISLSCHAPAAHIPVAFMC